MQLTSLQFDQNDYVHVSADDAEGIIGGCVLSDLTADGPFFSPPQDEDRDFDFYLSKAQFDADGDSNPQIVVAFYKRGTPDERAFVLDHETFYNYVCGNSEEEAEWAEFCPGQDPWIRIS